MTLSYVIEHHYIFTGVRWYTHDDYRTILWTRHYRPATPAQIAAGAKIITPALPGTERP